MIEHTKLQDILTCLVAVVIFICQLLNRLFCWVKNRMKPNRENISSIVTADTTLFPGTISNDGNIALENCIRVQELIQKHFDIPLSSAEQEPKVDDDVLIGDISPVSDSADIRWTKQNLDTVEEYMVVDDSFVARGLGLIAATVGRQSKFYIYSKYNDSFDGIVVEVKSRKGETGRVTVLGRRSKAASAMQPKSIPVDCVHDDDRIKVTYTPLAEGVHTVTLSKDDLPICRSPYYVSADKSPTDSRSRLRSGGKKSRTVTRPARFKTTDSKNDIIPPETAPHDTPRRDTQRHDTPRHDTARHKTTGDDNTISAEDKYEGRTDVRSIVTKFESKTFANRRNKCQTRSTCDDYENSPAETEIGSVKKNTCGPKQNQQIGSCSVGRTFETTKDVSSPDKEISENTNISIVTDDSQHCSALAGGIDTTKIGEYYNEKSQEPTVDQTGGNDDSSCGRTKEAYFDDEDDRKTVIGLDETDWPGQMSKCLCENCCKKVLCILQNIVAGDVRVTYNDESVDIENIQPSGVETVPAIRININIENKIQSDHHNPCLHNGDCLPPGPNEKDNTNRTNSTDVEKNGLTNDNSAIDETDTDARHTTTNSGSEKQQERIAMNQMESLSAKEYCSVNEIQTENAICNLSATEISANDIANTHDDLTDECVSNEIENAREEFTAEETNIPSITETLVAPVIDKLNNRLTPNAMALENIYLKNGTLDKNKSDISNSTENEDNTKRETNSDSKIDNSENVTPVVIPKNNDDVYVKDNNLTANTDLTNDLVSFIEKSIEPAIHSFRDTIINTILTIILNGKNHKTCYQLEQMADSAKPRCSDEIPFDTVEHTVDKKLQTSSSTQNTDFQHFIDIIENAFQAKHNNWTQIKMQTKFKSIMDSIMENRTEIIHDRHPAETVNIDSKIINKDDFEKSVISNVVTDCEQILETTENNNKQETFPPCELESDIKEEIAFDRPESTMENNYLEVKTASQTHYDVSKDTVISLDDKINDSAMDDNKLMTRDIKPNHDKGRIFVENLPPAESFETNELSVKYKIIDDAHISDANHTREPSTNDTNVDILKNTPTDNINSNTDDTKQHQTLSNDNKINDINVFTDEEIVSENLLSDKTSITTITNSENVTEFDLKQSHGNRRLSLQEYLEESLKCIDNQSDIKSTNETNINIQLGCHLVNTKSGGDSEVVDKVNEHFEINENNVKEICEDNSKDRTTHEVNDENEKLLENNYSAISKLSETAIDNEVLHVLCSHTEHSSDLNVSESNNEETVIKQQNSELDIFCEQNECSFPNEETDGKPEENLQCKNTSLDPIENILDIQLPVENVNSNNTETELDDHTTTDRQTGNIEHGSKEEKVNDLIENKPNDRIFQTNISTQSNKELSLNHGTLDRETLDDEIQIDLVVDQEISVELPVCKSSEIDKNVQCKKIICEETESSITSGEKIDSVNIPEIVLTHDEEPSGKYKDNTPVKNPVEILEMSANNIIEKVDKFYDDISQEITECGTKINFELVNDLERKKNLSETFETEETPICDAYFSNLKLSMDEIKIDQTENDGKDVEIIEKCKQIETFQYENTEIDDTATGKEIDEGFNPITNVICIENSKESSVQDLKAKQVLPKLERRQTCDNFDPGDGVEISGEIKNANSDKNETCADDIKDETKTNIQLLSDRILNKSFSLNETSVESLRENVQSTDLNINIEVHNHNVRRLSLQEYLEDTLQSLDNQLISDQFADKTNEAIIEVSNQDNNFTDSTLNHLNNQKNNFVETSDLNTKTLKSNIINCSTIENEDLKTSEDPINDNRRLLLQDYAEVPSNTVVVVNVTDVDIKSNYKSREHNQAASENLSKHDPETLEKSSDIISDQTSDVQLFDEAPIQNSEGSIDTSLPSKRLSDGAIQLDDVENNTKLYTDETTDGRRRLSLQEFLQESLESINSSLDHIDHTKRNLDEDYDPNIVDKDLNISTSFGSRDLRPDGSDKSLERAYGIPNFEGHQTYDNHESDDRIVSSEVKNAYSSNKDAISVDDTKDEPKTNNRALSNQILSKRFSLNATSIESAQKNVPITESNTNIEINKHNSRRLSLQEYLEDTLKSLDNQLISDQFANETSKSTIKVSNQSNNFTESTLNKSNQQENDSVEKEKCNVNTYKSNVDHSIIENVDFETSEDHTSDNRRLSLQNYSEEPLALMVTDNVYGVNIKSNNPREQCQTTSENLSEHNPVVETSSDVTSDQTSATRLDDVSRVQNSEENINAMQFDDVENNTKLYTDEPTDGRRRLSLQEFLQESLESINSSLDQIDHTKRNLYEDYDPDIVDKDLNIGTCFGSRDLRPDGSVRPLEKAYGIRRVEMSVQRVKSSDEEYFERTEKICLGNDTIKEHDEAVVDDRIYTVNESDLNAIVCASSLQEALTLLDSKIKLKCKKKAAKCDSSSVDAEQNEHFAVAREYFENMERRLSKQQ